MVTEIKGITVRVIKHEEQRYPTVGDWFINPDNGILFIHVSDMGDWRYNMAVAMHEAAEALICNYRNIAEEKVSDFDIWYEGQREKSNPECQGEPGDHKDAPYRLEHFVATTIERQLAMELNIDWEKYDEKVASL